MKRERVWARHKPEEMARPSGSPGKKTPNGTKQPPFPPTTVALWDKIRSF